jgi:hypothetical protein
MKKENIMSLTKPEMMMLKALEEISYASMRLKPSSTISELLSIIRKTESIANIAIRNIEDRRES